MTSTWWSVPDDSPFPVQNLPYGVVSGPDGARRLAVALGDHALDLAAVAELGLFDDVVTDARSVLGASTLNPLLARGRPVWSQVRLRLVELLGDDQYQQSLSPMFRARDSLVNHLPFDVADYVDFYSSEQHALNVGAIFRPDAPALPENWKHLPIGYHGRAGTVVVSGTPVVRPRGQRKPRNAEVPSFGPSTRLDIEAEVGFVVGTPTTLGSSVTPTALLDHVFGVVLLNDWSARDIQAWEYQPLGPFLGKSFATSISPWVVTLEALEAARVGPPAQDPEVFGYLRDDDPWSLDLALEVRLNNTVVSRPPFRTQYWTPGQQLAHMTVNGASLRTGDLFASGTVTGPAREERGSLLELSWGGSDPITLDDGTTRTFLDDGDTVSISAWAPGLDGSRIGFGPVSGQISAASAADQT
ncbi:MAG: fumarylacetoacetase [Actinomycetes bacterium]